uniref:FBA_2 domain-containing protein n=2 Tax=Caenorhabditis tropicalis TaxID=1561998 RepID=A0A1I7V1F2_9PELO
MMDVPELVRLSTTNIKVQGEAEIMKQIKSFFFLSFDQKKELNTADVFYLLQMHLYLDYPKFLRVNHFSFNLTVSNMLGIEVRLKEERILKWTILTEFIGDVEGYSGKIYFLRIDDQMIPGLLTDKNELVTFWNDRLEGLKTLVGWLMRKYQVRIEGFHVEKGDQMEFSKELISIVNFINYRQNSFSTVLIDEREELLDTDVINFLSKNVAAYSKYSHLGDRTKMRFPDAVNKSRSLLISHAHWFTAHHMFMTNCVFVTIVDSPMSNTDIRCMVRFWMHGRFPRLKHIKVKTVDVRVGQILDADAPTIGYIRDGVYRSENDELVDIGVGVVIRPKDVAATLIYPRTRTRRLITFQMVVWPDFEDFNYDRNVILPARNGVH